MGKERVSEEGSSRGGRRDEVGAGDRRRSYRVVREELGSVVPYRITVAVGESAMWENDGRYALDGVRRVLREKGATEDQVWRATKELMRMGATTVVIPGS